MRTQDSTRRPVGGGGDGRWTSEALLRPRHGRGSRIPIERDDTPRASARIKRAIAVPLLAGAVVLLVAVVIAIVMTAVQLQPAAEAASVSVVDEAQHGAADGSGPAGRGGDDGGEPAGDRSDDTDPPGQSGAVYVHVVGEVANPGVVEVADGTRVAEAIEAAGGATDSAVLDAINLARAVSDGEQIIVPDAQTAADARGGPPGAGGEDAPAVIDLNVADAALLETLPRVGPALAGRIIDWREKNGGFTDVEQLLEVSGIGAKTLDGFRDRVAAR